MSRIDRYTCEDLFRLLDDYLDNRLSEEQVQLVLAHLGICAVCATEYQFEASVLDQVRAKVARIEVPEGLLRSISDRIRKEQTSGGPHSASDHPEAPDAEAGDRD